MDSISCYRFSDTVSAVLNCIRAYDVSLPFLCFVRRKEEAVEVATALSKALGRRVLWAHGGLSPVERARRKAEIKSESVAGAVCTTIWSKGIDMPALRSVLRAAGGSAPIGLQQESGRGTRLFGAKQEFIIYDIEVKAEDPHRRSRLQGYSAAGYVLEGEQDDDETLVEVLQRGHGNAAREAREARNAPPEVIAALEERGDMLADTTQSMAETFIAPGSPSIESALVIAAVLCLARLLAS